MSLFNMTDTAARSFTSKGAATSAAKAAGFQDGEFTVSKGEGGWTYARIEPEQGNGEGDGVTRTEGTSTTPQGAAPQGDGQESKPQDGDTTNPPQGEQPKANAVSTAPADLKFPTVDHAVAWARCDGFAKNRIKVEQVDGGWTFRPLAEGEKYEAIGATPRTGNAPAFPAPGTKKRILIDLVCRAEGATMKELETAVGWKKCSGTLNELDETFGLDLEYRKKGGEGRYYGKLPEGIAPANANEANSGAAPMPVAAE
ncbi:DUF3489 domain-containing protein [Azospirillum rugosum]|uniref:DUF3489 domain-containing protein n=1 Tax=Azospirillum rugosum TaxID=416170 RepID=A0ABS4SEM6_9PROT|nr:DUF3489 domain-containing protein [Azospirillum rugosum]MBP2291033.1 hypothetical protein [Azospirillum rugosum]MDQ0524903.1 hypothetical protein [Azospirillum rugosum]